MKKYRLRPGRAVDFARSPPAGAFAGFVYYSALFPGHRLFPPVEQHSQHAAAGSQHQADPQRHIAAVPGLWAFCLPEGLPCCSGLAGSVGSVGSVGVVGVSRIRWLSGFNRLQRGTNLHIFFVLILCAGRIANNFLSRSRITGRYNRIGVAR